MGWGESCRGWLGHSGVGVGHIGMGWVMQWWGRVSHSGMGLNEFFSNSHSTFYK